MIKKGSKKHANHPKTAAADVAGQVMRPSYYTVLYYTALYYTMLYYTILSHTILSHTILYYTML